MDQVVRRWSTGFKIWRYATAYAKKDCFQRDAKDVPKRQGHDLLEIVVAVVVVSAIVGRGCVGQLTSMGSCMDLGLLANRIGYSGFAYKYHLQQILKHRHPINTMQAFMLRFPACLLFSYCFPLLLSVIYLLYFV